MIWCLSPWWIIEDTSSWHSEPVSSWYTVFYTQWFYAYNYNTFTTSIRFRTFRNFFPLAVAALVGFGYYRYRLQVLKINLFDEYCYLRSEELVKQNEYLFKSPEFEKWVYWKADFLETLGKIYRQGNDNAPSDFKDSELLLQDFINRYVDPTSQSPMKEFTKGIWSWFKNRLTMKYWLII